MFKILRATCSDRIYVRNTPQDLKAALIKRFTHHNPQRAKLRAMGRGEWREPHNYTTYDQPDADTFAFQRGGLHDARVIANRMGYGFQFADLRVAPPNPRLVPRKAARPYQLDALNVALTKQNCLILGGTGSGKTYIGLLVAAKCNTTTLIVVWNAELFDQWLNCIENDLGIKRDAVGKIGAGKFTIAPITVAMQQTLARLTGAKRQLVRESFGCVILDEAHRAPAATFREAIDMMPAKYRIALTADERRPDRKEFLTYDLFGQVAYKIDPNMLVREGYVVPVDVHIVPTGAPFEWYRDGEDRDFTRLQEEVVTNDVRNAIVVSAVRAAALRGTTIVFCNRREHCERLTSELRQHFSVGTMLGDKDQRAELKRTIVGLKDGSVRVGVGTVQMIGTGLDIPDVSYGVLAAPIGKNEQLFNQIRGRLCRAASGKYRATLVWMHDERAFGDSAVRNLFKWNDGRGDVVYENAGVPVKVTREWLAARAELGEYADGAFCLTPEAFRF